MVTTEGETFSTTADSSSWKLFKVAKFKEKIKVGSRSSKSLTTIAYNYTRWCYNIRAMGQKTHPVGFRLGITKEWPSKWFVPKVFYSKILEEDLKIKRFIEERYKYAGISNVVIERMEPDRIRVRIFAQKPGLVIGKGGQETEFIKEKVEEITAKEQIRIDVREVRVPELDAKLVASNIAYQIERRVSHRRAMKKAIEDAIKNGAKGIKVQVKGRLGGVELARKEWFLEGRMPLQTLRADIDYAYTRAYTKWGVIGVKVWIYKGDKIKEAKEEIKERLRETTKEE